MRYREWRLLLVKLIGPLALIYLGVGCTSQQLTEYAESGRAQEHSDAAVGGILDILTSVLSNPIEILVGLLLLAILAAPILAVGYLVCRSARRSRGGL